MPLIRDIAALFRRYSRNCTTTHQGGRRRLSRSGCYRAAATTAAGSISRISPAAAIPRRRGRGAAVDDVFLSHDALRPAEDGIGPRCRDAGNLRYDFDDQQPERMSSVK